MIHYTKNEPHAQPPYYTVMVGKVCAGTLEQEVDGYYYLIPKFDNSGAIASWILKDLYMKIEALNQAWDQKVGEVLNVPTKIEFPDNRHDAFKK